MCGSLPAATEDAAPARKDRTHWLYLAVIIAVLLGIIVGFVAPEFAADLRPLGTAFVNLIKMMISPVIFCTIVLGIGSIAAASKVGRVGGLALGYFLVMSTIALIIGLVVGNLLQPGKAWGSPRKARRRRRRRRPRRSSAPLTSC